MNAVMFSAEKAAGITYPAPCTDENCPKIHRLSKDERLHEDQLYIQILATLKQMGGGVHVRKHYFPSQQAKERLERVCLAQRELDAVPEAAVQGMAPGLNQILDQAKNRRLAAIKAQQKEIESTCMDYTISLPEIETDSASATDVLERLYQVYMRRSYLQ
jgi:hypothetical protein